MCIFFMKVCIQTMLYHWVIIIFEDGELKAVRKKPIDIMAMQEECWFSLNKLKIMDSRKISRQETAWIIFFIILEKTCF